MTRVAREHTDTNTCRRQRARLFVEQAVVHCLVTGRDERDCCGGGGGGVATVLDSGPQPVVPVHGGSVPNVKGGHDVDRAQGSWRSARTTGGIACRRPARLQSVRDGRVRDRDQLRRARRLQLLLRVRAEGGAVSLPAGGRRCPPGRARRCDETCRKAQGIRLRARRLGRRRQLLPRLPRARTRAAGARGPLRQRLGLRARGCERGADREEARSRLPDLCRRLGRVPPHPALVPARLRSPTWRSRPTTR